VSVVLVALLVAPLVALAISLGPHARRRARWLLPLAPLPALVAAALGRHGASLLVDPDGLRLTLALDAPRALLLGATATLWSLAGAYAASYLSDDRHCERFSVYWLLTLTGCLGTFVAADLASFYLLYALMSLAAWGLVVHDATPAARRAARVYLVLAVGGEAVLLLAFVMLAAGAPGASLAIADVVAALPASPHRTPALVFLLLGFGLKLGIVPLHGWLPLAHPAAPMPASAVLSGAIVKTGAIGLVLFLPWQVPDATWGGALIALGLATAYYAVVVGVTQPNPKTVLAYSTVSQMGLVLALLGAALAGGGAGAALAAALYAVHHVFVKGALFLGIGVLAATPAARRWMVLAPCAVLAASFAGVPWTGGMAAKLAAKPWLDAAPWKLLATLSAAGSTLLMLHFLRRAQAIAAPSADRAAPAGMVVPWAAAALLALVVPWTLYGLVLGEPLAITFSTSALVAALWPALVGACAAIAWFRLAPSWRPLPEGDVIVVAERAASALGAWSARAESLERALAGWTAAGAALVGVALALAALLVAL
jgi:formate hydrogenlyase subunit 3/multisubunit Na+/H+ antiporter MnhD subunit